MRTRSIVSSIAFASLVALPLRADSPVAAPAQTNPAAPAAAPAAEAVNPFFKEWTTPFGVPPFAEIKTEHYLHAYKEAIAQRRRDIDLIAGNTEAPTFANTIEAMENAGELLSKVGAVFGNQQSANTTPALQAINREVAPMLTALSDDINMNPVLFARIKAVWEKRDQLPLTGPQKKLLNDTYRDFVRSGALLSAEGQKRLREINTEMTNLGVKFGDNLLHDTNAFTLVIDKPADLAGLPPSVIDSAAAAAKAAGQEGKWLFNLQSPSIWPFMQYADNRDLRRQLLQAYTSRCDHNDEWDNKAIVAKVALLRTERVNLLGYKSHAEFVLEERMAKNSDRVFGLLNQLWEPSRANALKEAAELQEAIKTSGADFALEAWDWHYYSEKVRKARFDIDEQAVRAYFPLENVVKGAFDTAHKLYGITVTPRNDLPVYHPDVRAYEVTDYDGAHLGVFYTDYHPRAGKRVGAWSSSYRGTRVKDGRSIRPVVVNVGNFSRPSGDKPALLSLEEVETLFHEFGHGLHSLLSKVQYRGLASTPRDFVELPSQIMENWALEPEVLNGYAKHYKTGEVIPAELVEKIHKAEKFGQGFKSVEYLAAALLDMEWHTLSATTLQNASDFETAMAAKIKLPHQVGFRYRSPYFNHIFGPGGGYSSGYYSYIWSEVLDADAFQAFKETSLFDHGTARAFRTEVLERGASDDVMQLYKNFRGREPSVDALLTRRGLK